MTALLLAIFIVLLICGAPIAVCLGLSSAIVIVTHSMQQAARVSQKTAFFHLGNLVEFGETGQIFTNPVDPRTESYITGRIG